MRAVLMAGGAGTRLRPLTCDLPKPMVPVLNHPITEHIIHLLRQHQITEIIITVHYLPDLIRDYFGDGEELGVKISYMVEENQPLGTAGCVKNIAALLPETFLVISGDSITDIDLTAAIQFHRQKQSQATLVLATVSQPGEFGVVITDEQQRIVRFLEKPADGEVFSDQVNTGIYILEPQVLDQLSSHQSADFSADLFPRLLAQNIPMYGYVTNGYWCDVGNLEIYRQVHYDALHQRVQLTTLSNEQLPQVWVGRNTSIHPTAQIEGPVLIGDNCRIGAQAKIGAGTVIGDNVIVQAGAKLNQAIVWSNCILGEGGQLNACVIARGARLEQHVQIQEDAVIGAFSAIGEEAQINAGVQIWPGKVIEAGATLQDNLIWGSRGQRHLFGHRGVSGLANIEITPELGVKLGVASGAIWAAGSQVIISRDQRSVSRMQAKAISAGLMSVGIHVLNLESTALPLSRFTVHQQAVAGGIHVRVNPERADYLLIEFLDHNGINITKNQEKRIASAYFREDSRRAPIGEIGSLALPGHFLEAYSTGFERQLNTQVLRLRQRKVVIDYAYAVTGAILPELLNKLGCDVVVLNASLRQTSASNAEREDLLTQLGKVVMALDANFGVQVMANGERLTLIDETGYVIRGEQLTALMASICLSATPGGTVVVPTHTASAIELVAQMYGGTVIRTKSNPTSLMEACQTNSGVVMGGSAQTGFIFPQFHPGFDAMFGIAKLIEVLTVQQQSLKQLRANLPYVYHQHVTVRCPWSAKGGLMRYLISSTSAEQLELIDGVKIVDAPPHQWVLIMPDAGEPLMHIHANSPNRQWVQQQIQDYRQKVITFAQ